MRKIHEGLDTWSRQRTPEEINNFLERGMENVEHKLAKAAIANTELDI